MKQSLNYRTLAYHMGVRPGTVRRDISSIPLVGVVEAMNAYWFKKPAELATQFSLETPEGTMGTPEIDALIFYMLNHAVTVLGQKHHPYEPLSDKELKVLETYHNHLSFRSLRMFYYMLLICTRESRHDKNSHGDAVWVSLESKYGPVIKKFHKGIKGSGSEGAVDALKTAPPNVSLGHYTSFLSDIFYKGHYSSGFGGKAWGKVADVLRDYVHGTLSAEMMMDTAFTLCHNNGPIFNKGMLFTGYTDEIYKILDVQRSGQVPQLVGNNEAKYSTDPRVTSLYKLCSEVMPNEFSGYVDWYKVEDLGALKSYKPQKAAQLSKYGEPGKSKEVSEVEKMKAEFIKKKAENAKKAEEALWFEYMPASKVKQVEVIREV